MITYSLSVFIILDKILNIAYFVNFLFIPYLIYIYISKKSKFKYKIYSIIAISASFLLLVLTLLNNTKIGNFQFMVFRSLSLATFFVSIFGLLPFNLNFLRCFRIPIILSIPSLLFLNNQPPFYSYSSGDFSGAIGLFGFYGLVGLFNSSFYFAQVLISWIIFQLNIRNTNFKLPLLFKKFKSLDFMILLVLLLFTNRKAFMVILLFPPIANFFNLISRLFNNSVASSKRIFSIFFSSSIFISLFIIYDNAFHKGNKELTYNFIYDIFGRIQTYFYYSFISGEEANFTDTTFTYFKDSTSLFSVFLIIIYFFAVLNSLIRFRDLGLFNFLTYNLLIGLLIFKESATILSPSPSSLLIFMVISYLINSSHKKSRIKEFFDTIHQKKIIKK